MQYGKTSEGVAERAAFVVSAMLALGAPSSSLADILSNGPVVTHPGQGAGGASASAVQTTIGLNFYGITCDGEANTRVADDVVVPSGETWTVEAIRFLGFVSGSGTSTSTIKGVTLRVWDGVPGAGGQIVWGDVTTNLLAGEAFTNTYRTLDTNLVDPLRPVFQLVCITPGLVLTGGKAYWLDYQYQLSGPGLGRVPIVTLLGQLGKPGGNARWHSPATGWTVIDDVQGQDMAFEVQYSTSGAGPCYPDCDSSGALNIDDFICFQTYFAIGDPYADCDASGGLNIDDFICFQTYYAIGC